MSTPERQEPLFTQQNCQVCLDGQVICMGTISIDHRPDGSWYGSFHRTQGDPPNANREYEVVTQKHYVGRIEITDSPSDKAEATFDGIGPRPTLPLQVR